MIAEDHNCYDDEGYDDEDFEEFESHSRNSSPLRAGRANTPYKQVPSHGKACNTTDYVDGGKDAAAGNTAAISDDDAALNVDLESYMNKYPTTSQHPTEIRAASSSETQILDGLVPSEQQLSRRTLGYSPSPKKSSCAHYF